MPAPRPRAWGSFGQALQRLVLLLLAPVPIPAVAVPITFALSALMVNLAVTNTQKRI